MGLCSQCLASPWHSEVPVNARRVHSPTLGGRGALQGLGRTTHKCHPQPGPRCRKEEETVHLRDMRLLPRISMDPREHSKGNLPGKKVKRDKMYQSQLSGPIPEAELRSGVALPVTLVSIKFPQTFPLPAPFQIQPTQCPRNGYVSAKHHNTMGRDHGHQYNWQTKDAPHFTGKETGPALHHLPKFSQLLGSRVQIRAHSAPLAQSLGTLL